MSKGKTEKAKKKKESKKGGQVQDTDTGFITLPIPLATNGSGSGSPFTGSPAPKPGFSRVGMEQANSRDGTPGTAERSKVAFGFGSKRKAEDEAPGSPASKRR